MAKRGQKKLPLKTKIEYVVSTRGPAPEDLELRIRDAHARALLAVRVQRSPNGTSNRVQERSIDDD